MEKENTVLQMMHRSLREIFGRAGLDFNKLQEIRLRVDRPLTIKYSSKEWFMTKEGRLIDNKDEAVIVTEELVNETLEYMLRYSRYAFEEELRQGYITINGGHRVGIAGKVLALDGDVKNIRKVASLNVRISHEVKGCADKLMKHLYKDGRIKNTLIISPPCCGKTTLLRDMVRQISDGSIYGRGANVTVIDERSEIAASYLGVPQNDVGIRTDVLDDCPKVRGMMMAVRSLSPSVIAVDEIGGKEDADALRYVINSGCSVFATVHGSSLEDIKNKPVLEALINEGSFENYIVLDNSKVPGTIREIIGGGLN